MGVISALGMAAVVGLMINAGIKEPPQLPAFSPVVWDCHALVAKHMAGETLNSAELKTADMIGCGGSVRSPVDKIEAVNFDLKFKSPF